MAKTSKTVSLSTKKTAEADAISIATDTVDDELQDLNPEERDILRALTELEGSQDARWQIYRKPPLKQDQREGFLSALSSSELTMEEIQQRFGRGKYLIRGFQSTGRFLKQTTVEIAADPDKPPESKQQSTTSDTRDLLAILQDRDDKRSERTHQIMSLTIPAAITGLTTIIAALMNKPQAQSNGMKDTVELAGALKSLMTPQDGGMSTAEMMFKAMDFASKHAGKGEGGSGWMDIVREGMNTIAPLLEAKMATPQPALLPRPQQLATTTPQVQQPVKQIEDNKVNPLSAMKLLSWARDTLGYLTMKAAQDADASLYADWVIDNVPPGVDFTQFAKYLQDESWWTVLQQFQPAVTPHQEWFAEFRTLLIEVYEAKFGKLEGNENDRARTDTAGSTNTAVDDTGSGGTNKTGSDQ